MTYREDKQRIKDYAIKCIEDKSSTSQEFNGDLWFRKMKQKGHYIAGSKDYAFLIIDMDGRIYMNKIY